MRLITADGVSRCRPDEIEALLAGPDLVWIDVRYWDAETAEFLAARLHLHRQALHDCAVRNPVPKVHAYPDQTFVVLHAPEPGPRGHVHTVELDQFVGPNWLLTAHGPMSPSVPLDAAYVETDAVLRHLQDGRLRPTSGDDLSAALVNVMIERLRDYLVRLTTEVWELEQRVTGGHVGNPEHFLEELFGVRHSLLALHMMASTSAQIYGQMVREETFGDSGAPRLRDVEDQYRRVSAMADSERAYLQGVIEFYQTCTDTTMTIAAERLAVIAAVTLPITALSSVLGMNVIVNEATAVGPLVVTLVVMAIMSGILLVWTKRKGWW